MSALTATPPGIHSDLQPHFVLLCVCTIYTELCKMWFPCQPARGRNAGEAQTLFERFLPEAKLFPSKVWSIVKRKELHFWEQTERINQYFRSFGGNGCAGEFEWILLCIFPQEFLVGFGAQSSAVLMSITIEMLLKCLKKGNIDSGFVFFQLPRCVLCGNNS